MEISHRSKEFQAVMDEAKSLFKELLQIPDGYSVLFLGGGASLQFCMVPYNLLEKKAAYLNTGSWASKALKEAKLLVKQLRLLHQKMRSIVTFPKTIRYPPMQIIFTLRPIIRFMVRKYEKISIARFLWWPICRPIFFTPLGCF